MRFGRVSVLRHHFKYETLYGSGAVRGLTIFFPSLKANLQGAAADALRRAFFYRHGVKFPEAHDLQWNLCLFQKSCNPCYARLPPHDLHRRKTVGRVREWQHLLEHPFWPSLKAFIVSFDLEDDVARFVAAVQRAQGLAELV